MEKELQDRYGLTTLQLDTIKDIFKHTMTASLDKLFACKGFISEEQLPVKNVGAFVERCWKAGGVELLKSTNVLLPDELPVNSASQCSAWLIDRIIRKSLEWISRSPSQSSTDLSIATFEQVAPPVSRQTIQQTLIDIGKLQLEIDDKREELKFLQLKKRVKQLELKNQKLDLWIASREGNSIYKLFSTKPLLVASVFMLLFIFSFFMGLYYQLSSPPPELIELHEEQFRKLFEEQSRE